MTLVSKIFVVSKSKLKAHMLGYFRDLEKKGGEIIVTDNNKPVLKIIPYQAKKSFDEVFSTYQGKMKTNAPLEEPTEEEWGDLK